MNENLHNEAQTVSLMDSPEAAEHLPVYRELDARNSDGLFVQLLLCESGQIAIKIEDSKSNESFQFKVLGSQAMDAFHHPYAYAHQST